MGGAMQSKPHAIVTASDANCGDFLVEHWLRSLRANVDLREIDVVVLDFGLTECQRESLNGAIVIRASTAGSINVARRQEIARFLARHDYDQVLAVDAGDLVFQGDISHLFASDREHFRGVPERFPIPLTPFLRGAPRDVRRQIRTQLRGRPMVNGGFILAPARQLEKLGRLALPYDSRLRHDQPLVSCLLHEWGFSSLDDTYNFVPWTARERFYVERGEFFRSSGEKVAVVHNTGLKAPFRVIADFGYGPGYNRKVRKRYLRLASAYGKLAGAASLS
jgi:hypothetical protein